MDLGIANKVALVAASSKGLGRAVAAELGREGAHLILCARGESALNDAKESIEREQPYSMQDSLCLLFVHPELCHRPTP